MAHHICEDVCPGWKRVGFAGRVGGRSANDTLIVETCRQRGFTVITRDQGLVRKADNAQVPAMSPEEYASASALPLDTARTMFFQRFDASLSSWVERIHDVPRERVEEWFAVFRENFEFMWADDPRGHRYRI